MIKKIVAFLFMTTLVAAQSNYHVANFAGPYVPGIHAGLHQPGWFTYSQNFFIEGGTRIARRGITKALANNIHGSPILALKAFRHEGDSLVILAFAGGQWWFSNYAELSRKGDNWWDLRASGFDINYISTYTLNAFKEIRPYVREGFANVDFQPNEDTLDASLGSGGNETRFIKFVALGDTMWIDADKNGSYELNVGEVIEIMADSKLRVSFSDGTNHNNVQYQLRRRFDTSAVADIEIYENRAYVVNGIDPMQVIFWQDSTMWLREVLIAQTVGITDFESYFNITAGPASGWTSPTTFTPAKVDTQIIRFNRLFDFNKAWTVGEWSGQATAAPSEMYFFINGVMEGDGGRSSRRARCDVLPIVFNDENSIFLLNPTVGDMHRYAIDSAFAVADSFEARYDSLLAGYMQDYYPKHTENDSLNLEQAYITMKGANGYILSTAGITTTILSEDSTGLLKGHLQGAFWTSTDPEVIASIPDSHTDGERAFHYDDKIYFIQILESYDSKTRTTIQNVAFEYKSFFEKDIPERIPSDWKFIRISTGPEYDKAGRPRVDGKMQLNSRELRSEAKWVFRVPVVDAVNVLYSTRGFYPIRYALRNDSSGRLQQTGTVSTDNFDSSFVVTQNDGLHEYYFSGQQPSWIGARLTMTSGAQNTETTTIHQHIRFSDVPKRDSITFPPFPGAVGIGDTWLVEFFTDTAFFITATEPALMADSMATIRWRLVQAGLPRFSGLEAHTQHGLIGWGDTLGVGVLSRTSYTQRGIEPENWSPLGDVVLGSGQHPITAVESVNNSETVFTKKQIFLALPFTSGLWSYEELTQDIGCIAPRSVIVRNDITYFQSEQGYFSISRRANSGFQIQNLSTQMNALFNPLNHSSDSGHRGTKVRMNLSARHTTIAQYSERENRIWLFFAEGLSKIPNRSLTFSPTTNIWDGVHTLGASAVTTLELRDTNIMLIASPDEGMLVWNQVGADDSGGAWIRAIVEGVAYAPLGDTILATPGRIILIHGTDANDFPGDDSLVFYMENLGSDYANTISIDSAVISPLGGNARFLVADRITFDSLGAALFWRWHLEHIADGTNTDRRYSPIRMTIPFLPRGVGE